MPEEDRAAKRARWTDAVERSKGWEELVRPTTLRATALHKGGKGAIITRCPPCRMAKGRRTDLKSAAARACGVRSPAPGTRSRVDPAWDGAATAAVR